MTRTRCAFLRPGEENTYSEVAVCHAGEQLAFRETRQRENTTTSSGQMSVKYIHVFIKRRRNREMTTYANAYGETVGNPQIDLIYIRHLSLRDTAPVRWRNANPPEDKKNKWRRNQILHRFLSVTLLSGHMRRNVFLFFSLDLLFLFYFILVFFFFYSLFDSAIPLGRPVFRWI